MTAALIACLVLGIVGPFIARSVLKPAARRAPLFADSPAASLAIAVVLVFACGVLAWVIPMGPTS